MVFIFGEVAVVYWLVVVHYWLVVVVFVVILAHCGGGRRVLTRYKSFGHYLSIYIFTKSPSEKHYVANKSSSYWSIFWENIKS